MVLEHKLAAISANIVQCFRTNRLTKQGHAMSVSGITKEGTININSNFSLLQ